MMSHIAADINLSDVVSLRNPDLCDRRHCLFVELDSLVSSLPRCCQYFDAGRQDWLYNLYP